MTSTNSQNRDAKELLIIGTPMSYLKGVLQGVHKVVCTMNLHEATHHAVCLFVGQYSSEVEVEGRVGEGEQHTDIHYRSSFGESIENRLLVQVVVNIQKQKYQNIIARQISDATSQSF
jgi:hypothetical protein